MSKAAKKEEVAEESESKEVAKAKSTAVAAPADIDFDASAGAGSENMGKDDLAIPRINIIQALSPQRSKSKPEYIEGAEEGMIFENVSKTLWDGEEGITVVPVAFQKSYLEWAPRDSGKGLVNHHGDDASLYNSIEKNERFQAITNAGNEIIPTAEYFVFVLNEETGGVEPYVLSMSKSGLKHAKRWNSMINKLVDKHPQNPDQVWDAPIFWGVYKLKAVMESNQQGEWFRWEIEPAGTIKDSPDCWDIYREAEKFRKSIVEGAVKAQEPAQADHGEGDESDDDPM